MKSNRDENYIWNLTYSSIYIKRIYQNLLKLNILCFRVTSLVHVLCIIRSDFMCLKSFQVSNLYQMTTSHVLWSPDIWCGVNEERIYPVIWRCHENECCYNAHSVLCLREPQRDIQGPLLRWFTLPETCLRCVFRIYAIFMLHAT